VLFVKTLLDMALLKGVPIIGWSAAKFVKGAVLPSPCRIKFIFQIGAGFQFHQCCLLRPLPVSAFGLRILTPIVNAQAPYTCHPAISTRRPV
jgi:hypothetical protein